MAKRKQKLKIAYFEPGPLALQSYTLTTMPTIQFATIHSFLLNTAIRKRLSLSIVDTGTERSFGYSHNE